MIKQCLVCKKEFIYNRYNLKYCSSRCSNIKRKELSYISHQKQNKNIKIDCVICGSSFLKLRHMVCCSKKCSKINDRTNENKRMRTKIKNDPILKLNRCVSRSIHHSLKGNKQGRRWSSLVNYNIEELKDHLEKQFDSKMNWENYGTYWHIDHRVPQSLFNIKEPGDKEFKKCWALHNLQPLEAKRNISKSNRYSEPTLIHFFKEIREEV